MLLAAYYLIHGKLRPVKKRLAGCLICANEKTGAGDRARRSMRQGAFFFILYKMFKRIFDIAILRAVLVVYGCLNGTFAFRRSDTF